jgi:hypothetical protein
MLVRLGVVQLILMNSLVVSLVFILLLFWQLILSLFLSPFFKKQGLQSPFLESPQMPRALVDQFARFVNNVCPAFSVLPILIHDQKLLHIPCPIGMIKQEDIQTLVRYLLSLLEGSEAKRAQARPVAKVKVIEPEQNVIMKRLSGFDFGTLASLQPKLASTTNLAIQPASAWAHKAFKWASTSLVLPSNLFENIENESESLDQLLRADIGLPPRPSPPQLVRIKSSLSEPKFVTQSVSSPTPLGSQRPPSSTGSCDCLHLHIYSLINVC